MKNNMKIFAVSILGAIVLMLSLSFSGQETANTKSIMIRATQVFLGANNFIKVYEGNDMIETIELSGWSIKKEDGNYNTIMTTVQRYEARGYKIMSTSEIMFGDNGFVSTFILSK